MRFAVGVDVGVGVGVGVDFGPGQRDGHPEPLHKADMAEVLV